jgi:hypothetical protein
MTDYPPSWTCQKTLTQLEHYLLSTLALRDALAVAEHVEACDGCSQRLVLLRVTLVEHPRG